MSNTRTGGLGSGAKAALVAGTAAIVAVSSFLLTQDDERGISMPSLPVTSAPVLSTPSPDSTRAQKSPPPHQTSGSVAALTAAPITPTTNPCWPTRTRPCIPPATWQSIKSPPPFDAPVRFGREDGGMWIWIKAGEPSRPCNDQERSRRGYDRACAAKIGDPLYSTMRFTVVSE